MIIQRSLVLMIFLALSLSACSDDDEPQGPPPTEFTEATLVLNGEPLEFKVVASDWECNPGNLTLGVVHISENLEKGMVFGAANFPAKEGRYTLRRRNFDLNGGDDSCDLETPFGSALAYGGETLVAFYDVLEDEEPSELIITRYDPATQRLEGRLQMTLVIKENLFPIGKLEHPDTLRITQGSFVTNIMPPEE
ncbi:MAG: hypothetical protein AAF632_11055 [Bacteroidota bacterium]